MHLLRHAAVPVAAGALAFPPPGAIAPYAAPVTAAVTVTPGSTEVGGQVTVVATATNNTTSTVAGSLGIQNPQYRSERITRVSGHACAPRNLLRLIYCGNPQLAPGARMTITLSLRATATGTDDFTIYAGITGTSDIYAYGTLRAFMRLWHAFNAGHSAENAHDGSNLPARRAH